MDRDNPRKPPGTDRRAPPAESWSRPEATDEVCVRLTRKYADIIDGVNLEKATVGDRLELSQHDADILIAEGWAERSERPVRLLPRRAMAADSSRRPKNKKK